MKKLLLLSLSFIFSLPFLGYAQLASWNFTGLSSVAVATATTSDAGLTTTPILTRGATAAASAGNNSFRTVGFKNEGVNLANTDYFQFVLASKSTSVMSLTAIEARFAGTATFFAAPGVTSQFAYSLDGTGFVLIGSPIISTSITQNIDLSGISELQNMPAGSTVTIRYYASGQTTTGGWGFNSSSASTNGLTITGSINTINNGSPNISANNTGVIYFGSPGINASSTSKSVTVNYSNLDGSDVNVITNSPFTIAKSETGTYSNTLNFTNAELTGAEFPLFVKYTPNATATVDDLISITGGGTSATTTVNLNGVIYDSYTQNFDDANYLSNSGWSQANVSGTINSWTYTTSNPNSAPGAALMNGFSDTNTPSNDWLISPKLDLTVFTDFAMLQFYSREFFAGPDLKLMVSTTHNDGDAIDPSQWTEITGNFPATTGIWQLSENINLDAYKSANTHIAFVYQTNAGGTNNSSEWRVDDFKVQNKVSYASIPSQKISFPETLVGANSTSSNFKITAGGYGNISIVAPTNFQVSLDNITFSSSVTVASAELTAGKIIYTNFTPTIKSVDLTGVLSFSGTNLTATSVTLTGNSYPKAETFDIAAYNLEFFGSDVKDASNVEFGPTNDALQVANVSAVLQKLDLDVIAVEEVSDVPSFNTLVANLPGYAGVLSSRYSYSFEPPSPYFPAQQIGFIYNTSTVTKVSEEVLFVTRYDAARFDEAQFPNYPTGTASSFWSSGRLPYMVTFDSNIGGNSNTYRVIVIHAKSGGDIADHNRRAYDNKVLYDYLNTTYPNDKIIILGDYNDKVVGSISSSAISSYNDFVSDPARYSAITASASQELGAGTYIGSSTPSFIDHIMISNELNEFYLANSIAVKDPRAYITSYATTTSDHLPIQARFTTTPTTLPIKLVAFTAKENQGRVNLKWTTASETDNDYFTVERSSDGKNFTAIKKVQGAGTSSNTNSYTTVDENPASGNNYYRLRQTDLDGKFSYSQVEVVKLNSFFADDLTIYPNPVSNQITLKLSTQDQNAQLSVSGIDGRSVLKVNGSISSINEKLNSKLNSLPAGVYIIKLVADNKQHKGKFIKQ